MLSDSILIEQARQQQETGRNQAFDTLISRYKLPLYRFINRMINDEGMAEDILQTTFMRVYFNLDQYNVDQPFKTWLYQIAVNLCRDSYRRAKVRNFLTFNSQVTDTVLEFSHSHDDTEQHLAYKQQLKTVQQAIRHLPYKLRTALLLFTVEEYSLQECADILQVTPKAVETRVYRARKELEKILSGVMLCDA